MEIRTYQNKIVLVDDDQFAIAEVDFPAAEGRDGVVEISHTFVDDSMRGRGVAGKLMEKTVEHLRRENLKGIPSCSYATAWFSKHREALDVLDPTAAAELFPDDEAIVDQRVEDEAAPDRQFDRSMRDEQGTGIDRRPRDEQIKENARWTQDEKDTRTGQRTESREDPENDEETKQKIIPFRKTDRSSKHTRDGKDDRTSAGSRIAAGAGRAAAGTGRAAMKVTGKAAGAIFNDKTVGAVLLIVSRIFQVVSAFLMAFLLILISVPALRALDAFGPVGSMLTDRNIPEIAYIAAVAGTCLYLAISVLWILTRKKYASEDHLVSIDTGRGITAFLLVVLLEAATELFAGYPEPTDQVALGLYGFITILYQHTELSMRLAIGGLLLSVVRKIIGR